MADSLSNASDTELAAIAAQVVLAAAPTPAMYGTTAAVITALDAKKDTFQADLDAHIAAQAAAKAATATKEASRALLIEALRSLRNVAKAASVSDAAMNALGIPVGNTVDPPAATVPVGSVDTSERLRHTISWTDAASPGIKRRPRGAIGAELWHKIDGPPPTDEKDCTFLTLDTATPYVAQFDGSQAGKMVHYMLRWRMRDGSVTAWGETVSATITG
jgi:hypothetical protein